MDYCSKLLVQHIQKLNYIYAKHNKLKYRENNNANHCFITYLIHCKQQRNYYLLLIIQSIHNCKYCHSKEFILSHHSHLCLPLMNKSTYIIY